MSEPSPPIRGFLESTLIDWEGKVACEVFLPTCNLRCPFCHAGHLVMNDGTLESIPIDAVTGLLDRQRGWVDGVVISGGEPTLHEALPAMIDEFRSHGALIKLDTNGTRPEVIERLIADGRLDAISMDVKAPFDERYDAATNATPDLDAIRRSVDLIMGSHLEYEFRTTVCRVFHGRGDIREIAESIAGARKYILQQFKPGDCLDPALNEVESYSRDELREFAEAARPCVELCILRGDWAGAAEQDPAAG
ncbi:MAG: anaerobic ribonucleoside-triphosphate reductase activating protein [Planctomycetota bacterium]